MAATAQLAPSARGDRASRTRSTDAAIAGEIRAAMNRPAAPMTAASATSARTASIVVTSSKLTGRSSQAEPSSALLTSEGKVGQDLADDGNELEAVPGRAGDDDEPAAAVDHEVLAGGGVVEAVSPGHG